MSKQGKIYQTKPENIVTVSRPKGNWAVRLSCPTILTCSLVVLGSDECYLNLVNSLEEDCCWCDREGCPLIERKLAEENDNAG